MNCEKCEDTGWMKVRGKNPKGEEYEAVKPCECRTAAKAEREKAHPGGFEAIGPLMNRVIESMTQSSNPQIPSIASDSRTHQPDEKQICESDGVKYAAARAATLGKPECEIAAIILNHRGHENAIKIDEIRKLLPDLDSRAVKGAVENIRRLARLPVAAAKEPPYGYFIPRTAEEARDCHDRLFREGIRLIELSQLFERDRDLVRELEGQLRAKFEE